MNTEYSVGNIRIHFESRSRRRRLVVLVYAVMAVFDLRYAAYLVQGPDWLVRHVPWFVCLLGILFVVLFIVFTWLTNDIRLRGDERETHRREHAYAKAYRPLGYFLAAALFASFFRGLNPITPILPLTIRAYLLQLPFMLLFAIVLIYATLPQAILLWTEPDMEAEQG